MNKKNVLIWDYALDGLVFDDKANGIAVQLYFWSMTFHNNGWNVAAISTKQRQYNNGISFVKIGKSKLDILVEWIKIAYAIKKTHSDVIIFRGADRRTFPIALASRLLKTKFLFFAASDVNFVPGKELIHGVKFNRKLYQKSIRHIPYIVVQNTYQKKTLQENYGKTCLVLPNIWLGNENIIVSSEKSIDVIWVANFRRLKRAEWMVEAAKNNPHLRFALIGRPSADLDYYKQMEHECSELENVSFYGPLGFDRTNALVAQSRILACTSEFEGFPNTFLQAWAYTLPVVSTVDPSNVIERNNLGKVVKDKEEFCETVKCLLENVEDYGDICKSINDYFLSNHSPDINFSKLMAYIQEE